MPGEIWECAQGSWQIGIGDPGLMGWSIVGLYFLSGLVALLVAGCARFPYDTARRERVFWVVLGLILLALGVNKQLDLQSLLTAVARCMAQLQGWYDARRIVQIGFIVILVAVMLLMTLMFWSMLKGTLSRTWLGLFGLMIVLTFVAVRAVGFHHMDQLINMEISDLRVNWLLEMTGPVMVLCAGALNLRNREYGP
ncbi:isopropylmalate isomerase [Yoonia sp. 2307UL14-13]|uniref:isopropylmalate isomerase n=1 Tax=Yoonia sp. 2307UL14-13 TaxID=3126506 RepID=UPI00309FF8C2